MPEKIDHHFTELNTDILNLLEGKDALKAFYADLYFKFTQCNKDKDLKNAAMINKEAFLSYLEKIEIKG